MVGESFGQPAVVNVGKQANANSDGPAGPQGALSTMRVNEVVAASTWSKEILRERGLFIGQDCIYVGITQLWSPGCNIHRTPYSGRNFEYYSEDSVMSYICASVQCAAMQEKGCNAAPKHFAGNDQETNRGELCIYTTEQAFRQGPLKGFEGAFTEGGALGTMMSCSRIGNYHTYTCKSVLTGIMREEWNFHGITITDSVAGWTLDNPTLVSFAAGTDTFNARAASGSELKKYTPSDLNKGCGLQSDYIYLLQTRDKQDSGLVASMIGEGSVLIIIAFAAVSACIIEGIYIIKEKRQYKEANNTSKPSNSGE